MIGRITTVLGGVTVYAPDYSIPGMREQVECEVALAEIADAGSNLLYLLRRLNEEQDR
jgi:hypothetical protein